MPLLFDKKLAREAMPDVKLPRYTGGYPEDAAVHVGRAIAQHTLIFGKPPRGMWPAEGCVCQAMLPLLAEHGIRWIATDEEILSASTQGFISRDQHGHVRNPDQMYRPYKVAEAGHELGIVFRDHALSDMIGFHYQRSEPVAAADDLLNRLRAIGQAVRDKDTALVSIILDGENCWEHYPGGGVLFLRSLYRSVRRPRIFIRCASVTSWSNARRTIRCRTCSPAVGSITTFASGWATRKTTLPGTPCTIPANISRTWRQADRETVRPGISQTPRLNPSPPLRGRGTGVKGFPASQLPCLRLPSVGRNLHRRGQRLVLVVWRRTLQRSG